MCTRAVLLGLRALQSRLLGRTIHFTPLKASEAGEQHVFDLEDDQNGSPRTLELSAFTLPK